MRHLLLSTFLTGVLLLSGFIPLSVFAAAPPKLSGQPYAESICSTDPNIILCEDFDDPAIATCNGTPTTSGQQRFQWFNSGLSGQGGPDGSVLLKCGGASFIPQSQLPELQPTGSPSGGYAKKHDYKAIRSGSTWRGCTWGDCNRSTYDTIAGKTYKNGNPAQPHIHVRFQFYVSTDHTWPRQFDNKFFFLQPNKFPDNPGASINSGFFVSRDPGYCNGHKHSDVLAIATGGVNAWPAKRNISGTLSPQYHPEYCNGQGMGYSNGPMLHNNEVEGACPGNTWGCNLGDTPTPGRVYRISKGEWITMEFRYVPGTRGLYDGSAAVWVDGVKIYEDFDLRTCNDKGPAVDRGDCVVQDFFFGAYVGTNEPSDGYWLMDNLVMSTSYIGPPQSGNSVDLTPPNPPTGVTLTSLP